MTEYTTVEKVRQALAPTAVPPGDESTADTAASLGDAQLVDAVRQASARIDSYIGQRYTVPVAPVDPNADELVFPDPAVAYWARDIAAYLASLTFYRNMPMEPTDPIFLRYKDAIADLTAVQAGKSILQIPGATGSPDSGDGYAGVVDAQPNGLFDASDIGMHPQVPFPGGWPGGVW